MQVAWTSRDRIAKPTSKALDGLADVSSVDVTWMTHLFLNLIPVLKRKLPIKG
jgi:hypothetical protein